MTTSKPRRYKLPPEKPVAAKDDRTRPGAKVLANPAYREWAESVSIWRTGTIALLPQIRKEQEIARENNDQAGVDALEQEYQEILALLARN